MPGFLSPGKGGKGMPLLLIPEYSEINKGQRVPDRSKTAHRKPLVKCFLTLYDTVMVIHIIIGLSKPIEFTAPVVNHSAVYGVCIIRMYRL